MPEWLPQVLTFLSGIAGGFMGARGAIIRLQTQMESVLTRVDGIQKQVHRHNDDLLIHDMEIETVLAKLEIPRARRQRLE